MKKTHIVILIVMVVAIAVVIGTIHDSGAYADFDKAKKNPGETFQIIGQLNKKREIKYDSTLQNQSLSFYLIDDKGVECRVLYYGSKPNDFVKLQQLVVTGKMEGCVFIAGEMLLKCPSKYTKEGEFSN
ncbi:MAG: cytochrome c maturation protein CcmE [Bacteroidales bacterium]